MADRDRSSGRRAHPHLRGGGSDRPGRRLGSDPLGRRCPHSPSGGRSQRMGWRAARRNARGAEWRAVAQRSGLLPGIPKPPRMGSHVRRLARETVVAVIAARLPYAWLATVVCTASLEPGRGMRVHGRRDDLDGIRPVGALLPE